MKRKYMIVYLMILTVMVNGCGDWWNMMSADEDNTIVIEGTQTLRNTRLILAPGTRVKFKTKYTISPGGDVSWSGGLIIGAGASLVAKGTRDNPIIFEVEKVKSSLESGYIEFSENCKADESIIEYCWFKNKTTINYYNNESLIIRYSKFEDSDIHTASGNLKIEHNTFYESFIYNQSEEVANPIILYNYLNVSGIRLNKYKINPVIKFNNIINYEKYAIYWWCPISEVTNLVISENYIANCNGLVGVDTNGSQSYNVLYSNYRTTPVPDAGCGW